MILVDTNVWIDHLQSPNPTLIRLLEGSRILMHPMVLGELACGNLKNRAERLDAWRRLPQIEVREHHEAITWIESEALAGSGIGFIDAHLLHAVLTHRETRLWTGDKSLRSLANRFGSEFPQDKS